MCALAAKNKGELTPGHICENLKLSTSEKTLRPIAALIANILMLHKAEISKQMELYTKVLGNEKETHHNRKLAAIVIGNIGQANDLSKNDALNTLLNGLLKNPEEEIKMNAAICLGKIALGNKARYIPFIMTQLKTQSEISYLMLVAVREIVALNCEGIVDYVKDILPVLKSQADTDNEGDRTIVAEIIGKLLLANEALIFKEVETNLKDGKPNVRATYALSFKYWYFKGKQDLSQFSESLLHLLELLNDKSPKVHKALLDSFTHIAHINATHLRAHCATLFKGVLPLTIVNPSLIRTVDLGPLKHKIDDGEPIRKGAYSLLGQMLTDLYDKMDLPAIVDRLVDGLADESDEVQSIAEQILIKVCEMSPGVILGPLEKILEHIMKGTKRLQEKIKKSQDVDRSSDNIRGFLRVLLAMNKLPEIDLNLKYQESLKNSLSDKIVSTLYEELSKLTK